MGKLSGYNENVTSIVFADQAGDGVIAAFKAPAVGARIASAYVIPNASFNADAENFYAVSLLNGGTTGAAAEPGTLATVGGSAVDWVAKTAKTMTISDDGIAGGEWVLVDYAETGTVAPGTITVVIFWTAGGS